MPAKKRVTKKSKPKVNKPTGPTIMDRLPKNRGEWLELVIKMTEKHVKDGKPDFLAAQAERLKSELTQWKSENS